MYVSKKSFNLVNTSNFALAFNGEKSIEIARRLEEARRIKGFNTRYSYIESKCINYEDIDKHLSCTIERPKTPLPKNLTLEEIMDHEKVPI